MTSSHPPTPPSCSTPSTSARHLESSTLEKQLTCKICLQLLREPNVTSCGHTFCSACIRTSLQFKPICPICSDPLDFSQLFLNHTISETLRSLSTAPMHPSAKRRKPNDPDLSSLSPEDLSLPALNSLISSLISKRDSLLNQSSLTHSQLLQEFLSRMILKRTLSVSKLTEELSQLEQDKLSLPSSSGPPSPTLRKRLEDNLSDLEEHYLSLRARSSDSDTLKDFADTLEHVLRFKSFRSLSKLSFSQGLDSHTTSIVSSIEFDKDSEYFAIAGVTKKIRLYEYSSVLNPSLQVHYPLGEIPCCSKISWNSYHKAMLASSDYDGMVELWDTSTQSSIRRYNEHEKRCWCVSFSLLDPHMLASASDDTKVKIWRTEEPDSVSSIDARVNVCCVEFNPCSRYQVSFGTADHAVYTYDLRQNTVPLCVYRAHRKAVSYVRYLGEKELLSASMRLWTVPKGEESRSASVTASKCTFRGHVNEKNFVGLATDGDYILCGSENNSVYVYYKRMPKPVLVCPFGFADESLISTQDTQESTSGSEFVSAVCWKKGSNVILAANSQGLVRILELV